MPSLDLKLEPEELSGVIESLHNNILNKLRYSTYRSPEYVRWRTLPIETVQVVIDGLIAAYTKAVMLYREANFKKTEKFEDTFFFSEEVWDSLAFITTAGTWDDIPFHDVHDLSTCAVCSAIYSTE